jgi:hypothetical protein
MAEHFVKKAEEIAYSMLEDIRDGHEFPCVEKSMTNHEGRENERQEEDEDEDEDEKEEEEEEDEEEEEEEEEDDDDDNEEEEEEEEDLDWMLNYEETDYCYATKNLSRYKKEYVMGGGSSAWWNYIVDFDRNGEQVAVYIENKDGAKIQTHKRLLQIIFDGDERLALVDKDFNYTEEHPDNIEYFWITADEYLDGLGGKICGMEGKLWMLNALNYLLRNKPKKIIQNLDGTLSIAPDDEDI